MKERTLLLIKPNAVRARHAGEIISIIEREGFDILKAMIFRFDPDLSRRFYVDHLGKEFYPRLEEFMCSGVSWALVLERENAVHKLRDLLGDVIPEKRLPGTIRALYGEGITDNGAHGSDCPQSAIREIGVIFGSQ
ncbi:MAG: nucleoside-diphosphate kinase [Candidatus Cloacimonetes bacterium]|jgi:nucleoside-diphosphate kinase|nr:nucleoside-diphosphate kinase [Candidatus Cloacimonadota bacterium]MDD4100596.1 nucleoside-diphosphate kinase [Candidatus Cloacimonadota bacterium]MDD4806375.1 nucleoside-diphosphate kinase [Candidatus Cloacimonadota bacterium]